MSDFSARLDLPLIKPSQAQKHVTHNEALQVLDGLVQTALEQIDAVTPPFEPAPGSMYALGANPVGDWGDQGGRLAYRSGEGWVFISPQEGWRAWDKQASAFRIYHGGAWNAVVSELENLSGVGIGTTSDAVNRLAVSSEATLLNHDGAGHQLKVNKASDSDTASLLFQSGFTGHAEMGLAGDTGFSIKVSPDGSNWSDAIKADPVQGEVEIGLPVTGTAVQQSPIDATPNRLIRTGGAVTVLSGGLESRALLAGTPDSIELSTRAGFSTIPVGYQVRFRALDQNTGPANIILDGISSVPCVTVSGASLPPGYIRTDVDTTAIYDGNNWVLDRIAESGSNSNGHFIRFANGFQTAARSVTLSYAGASKVNATVDFAATFASAGKVFATFSIFGFLNSSVPLESMSIPRCFNYSTTGCMAEIRRITGMASFEDGDQVIIRLVANGRWY